MIQYICVYTERTPVVTGVFDNVDGAIRHIADQWDGFVYLSYETSYQFMFDARSDKDAHFWPDDDSCVSILQVRGPAN